MLEALDIYGIESVGRMTGGAKEELLGAWFEPWEEGIMDTIE